MDFLKLYFSRYDIVYEYEYESKGLFSVVMPNAKNTIGDRNKCNRRENQLLLSFVQH